MNNILNISHIPQSLEKEYFQDIFKSDTVRIERIVSTGHTSPKDFWYDQAENEWVVVLQGQAILKVQNEHNIIVEHVLHMGEYINLPPHTKHRVEYTDTTQPTIWLAVFST